MNANNLRASTLSKTEGNVFEFMLAKERLYVKDNHGLDRVYTKDKALEFNEIIDGEGGFEASYGWGFNI